MVLSPLTVVWCIPLSGIPVAITAILTVVLRRLRLRLLSLRFSWLLLIFIRAVVCMGRRISGWDAAVVAGIQLTTRSVMPRARSCWLLTDSVVTVAPDRIIHARHAAAIKRLDD